jgi:carboxyl-terminal processing protease
VNAEPIGLRNIEEQPFMRLSSVGIGITLACAVVVAGSMIQAKRSANPIAGSQTIASITDLRSISLQNTPPSPGANSVSDADDPLIARLTAQIISQSHYLHKPIDEGVSSKLLDRYLDALDPLHFNFLQSDVQDFDKWRTRLGTLLMERGNTTPANKIFAVFLERFDQQVAYVNEQLKKEQFSFDTDEMYTLDRKSAPRPKDMDEAKHLWLDHLHYEYLQEKLNKQKPEEIIKTLTRRYSRMSRSLHEYDHGDIFQLYLTTLAHVYDPHSDYMGKALADNFGISMKLSLFGIGALLTSEDGYCKIETLTPGGPAIKSNKLKPGDRIVAVGQSNQPPVDVIDMKLDKIVEMIRGPKGTEVRLTIIPAESTDLSTRKVVTLIRDQVKLEEQEAKTQIIDLPADKGKTMRLGVIDLPSFYADMDDQGKSHKSTTTDVLRLLTKLKKENVQGVILDLRHNGGGSLDEAIRLTGLFIKKGPVVQVKDADGQIRVDKDPDPAVHYDGPLIVLTSKFSASASEILTGALQDYGRALIVGDTSTFGKGSVQAVIQLGPIMQRYGVPTHGDPGELKLTIQKFYRISGASTQLKGVVPDIILPSLNNVAEYGEKYLENPMPWDTIPSASYDKLNRVQPVLADLRQRSEKRVATDKDFAFLRQQIDWFKTLSARKKVSLNEQQRMKEKQEAQQRANAYKAELKARPESKEKVYQITLKQVDMPGLPAPLSKTAKTEANKPPVENDPEAVTTPDEGVPAIDITMEEVKRILMDFISVSPKAATASRTP